MNKYTPEIVEQVETLLNVGIALSAEKDHNRLLEMILTEARRITGADAGTLYLCEDGHLVFKIIQNETMGIFQGGRGEPVDLPPVPLREENVSAYVVLTRRSVNVADVYAAEGFDFSGPKRYDSLTGYRTTSMLVIPLENHEGEIIGVLQLINARDQHGRVIPFAPYLEKVVSSLASQAAIALTNMQFIQDIENLFNSFVEVMATAIDARTPYNANHTRRVALLAGEMVGVINAVTEGRWGSEYFDDDRAAQLVMAAWMHDIGKVATPLSVMNKATRLEGGMELVLQRLDYIAASLRAEYLQRKMVLANEGARAAEVETLDRWWQEQVAMVEQARELVIRADNPATFVSEEMVEELEKVARRTYVDAAGEERPWLTRGELEQLSVPRGTLTDTERKIMEDHVEVTRRMLEKIPFTRKLKDVPYLAGMHHEHLDGKGYPQGLKGDEIPLEGRILALLDVFDALTAADRPYKKAVPVEEALKILGFMVKDGKLDAELFEHFRQSRIWERLE